MQNLDVVLDGGITEHESKADVPHTPAPTPDGRRSPTSFEAVYDFNHKQQQSGEPGS